LYKFRRRAFEAVRAALADKPRGPKRPHNHLDDAQEQKAVSLCQRYPALSSYRIAGRIGHDAPSPRTIQRIRERHHLARVTKRASPSAPSRKLSPRAAAQARALLHEKPYLGPDRLAWDLWNGQGIHVSPSTFKRYKRKWRELMKPVPLPSPIWRFYERHHPHSLWHGDFLEKVTLADLDQTAYPLALMDDYSRGYVFCDLILNPDLRTTIRAIIAAMRQWRVIPGAIVFDNGSTFKGKLLSVFCERVGIRLIHSAVNHPQTNGKLERAFRDDMRDFYRQHTPWLLEPLRRDLPAYIHYRNYVRGHHAFGDKDSKAEPFANLSYGYVNVPGFTEQGGAAALTAKDSEGTLGSTTLGARVRQVLPFLDTPKNKAAFQASAGWLHTIGDVNPETSLRFAGGSSFKTQAAPLARDAAVLGAGVDYLIGDQTTLGVAYTGQIGDHADTQAVRGNVSYRF
jgi:transposase InsO family protein